MLSVDLKQVKLTAIVGIIVLLDMTAYIKMARLTKTESSSRQRISY